MIKFSASDTLITANNHKLSVLRKYEIDHRHNLPVDAIYWAVVHEIEYLEQQNKELAD
ncbi:hypothetical protein ACFP7A_00700 [Sporolactobacillus kofuensis]|uniref:Uncharacterized protein n=1 Tax=Sporolactobacillus kofuensis TaxID=269672 RepID=A0ABW1WDD1_9BACL|nr:hypothetical protein [Sporolactobacillus kofuensis]MCO7175579.1 hypothetical protein [Sporolactobacillus kofuensis]